MNERFKAVSMVTGSRKPGCSSKLRHDCSVTKNSLFQNSGNSGEWL